MVGTRNFPLDDVMTSFIELRVGLTFSVKLAIAEFMSSNIPSSPAHGMFISQLIRYAGLAPLMNVLFWMRRDFHVSFSGRDMSGNIWNRPSWSSVVDMGISSNIMKSPSPKCYMAFWDVIIYSDTLHWSDISLNRDLVTELDLITVFDVITLFREVSIGHCNGCS